MCVSCRIERMGRTDWSVEAIRDRHEKWLKNSGGNTGNSLIIERGILLEKLDEANSRIAELEREYDLLHN
jgi:hypothetical protein